MKRKLSAYLVKLGLIVGIPVFLSWGRLTGKQMNNFSIPNRDNRAGKELIVLKAGIGFRIKKITAGKIFTPNGDGWNEYFEIQYENLADSIISARIYNLKGRYISGMKKDSLNEILIWNGKDFNGNLQPGGVYIWQIDVSGYETIIIQGTVVLAR